MWHSVNLILPNESIRPFISTNDQNPLKSEGLQMTAKQEPKPHLISEDIEFHDLPTDWTFWYLIPNRTQTKARKWDDFLKTLHDFSTIEDFWAIINSIESPSKLPKGCRYYIFKTGIKPLWEDENNLRGYEICCEYPTSDKTLFQPTEKKWTDVVLNVICKVGNKQVFDYINGIEFNNRGTVLKVGIWVSHEINEANKKDVIQEFARIMESEEEKVQIKEIKLENNSK